MANRTKFEIWAEILEACLWNGRSQTWLKGNLRMKTQDIKNNLIFLQKRNLIEIYEPVDKDYYIYKTTVRGKEALEDFFSLITNYFNLKKKC